MTWEEGSLRKTKGEEVFRMIWGVQNVKERSGMAETTTHRFVKKKTLFYGR